MMNYSALLARLSLIFYVSIAHGFPKVWIVSPRLFVGSAHSAL